MKFNPEKSLFQLAIIQITFLVTMAVSVASAIIIYINSNLTVDFSYKGFNDAIDVFKFSIGALAVGISLIGIFGANHRSEQTKKQIERTSSQITLTRSQNNFSNYYKHIEEFDKYCEKIKNPKISISSTRALYRKLFHDSKNGNFSLANPLLRDMNFRLKDFLTEILRLETTDTAYYRSAVIRLLALRNRIASDFFLNIVATAGQTSDFSDGEKTYKLFDTSHIGFINEYKSIFLFINQLLHFDMEYSTPIQFRLLENIDLAPYKNRRIDPNNPSPLNFSEIFGHEATLYVLDSNQWEKLHGVD